MNLPAPTTTEMAAGVFVIGILGATGSLALMHALRELRRRILGLEKALAVASAEKRHHASAHAAYSRALRNLEENDMSNCPRACALRRRIAKLES